ncbi:hypothetical protein ACUH9Y_08980 [Dermabacteraceae bacterium P13115]
MKVLPRITAVFATALLAITPGAAMATPENGFSDEVRQQLAERFHEYSVPENLIAPLTNKVLSGETLDSDKPNATPVSTDEREVDGMLVTQTRYADGSFTIYEVETGSKKKGRGISGCVSSSTSWTLTKKNCLVKGSTTLYSASFRADYTFGKYRGGRATINKVYDPNYSYFIGSVRGGVPTIARKHSQDRIPAVAKLRFHQDASPIGGRTVTLYLELTNRGGEKAYLQKGV